MEAYKFKKESGINRYQTLLLNQTYIELTFCYHLRIRYLMNK